MVMIICFSNLLIATDPDLSIEDLEETKALRSGMYRLYRSTIDCIDISYIVCYPNRQIMLKKK